MLMTSLTALLFTAQVVVAVVRSGLEGGHRQVGGGAAEEEGGSAFQTFVFALLETIFSELKGAAQCGRDEGSQHCRNFVWGGN